MIPLEMTSEQIGAALQALEQALFAHEEWVEVLNTTLICGLPADVRDLSPDAHKNCRFGQWCDSVGAELLGSHPAFPELVGEHARMHAYAAALVRSAARKKSVDVKEYELLLNATKRVGLEVMTLRNELETMLHNLDPLTGIPGRIGVLSKLRAEHALIKRKGHSCTIAMLDLDRFKRVNDTYGHLVGDKVLTIIARHMTRSLRPYDAVFRYGGEEFLICLPDADVATARDVVDRLRESLAALPLGEHGGRQLHMTISCGVAALEPELSVEEAISRADQALYAAKEAGRNRTRVWEQQNIEAAAA